MKSSYYGYKEREVEELIIKETITESVVYVESIDIFTLIYQGNLISVRKAIKNGDISLYHRNDQGQTPLHWAVLYNQIEIAKELVTLGASLDVTDNKGNTVKDIINLYHPEIQNSLAIISSLKASSKENFVENEQDENQDTSLLGGIKDNCEIF
ncbi:Ankyrin repeat domain-containing protein (plasmid) [Candidatus Trichorickettsia mobilis]|uniref:ankyrin repeat domain-containing protein n=1 Tax=Candidatus Trichorickettsia mobilis TaxID=1346319 RepID=UPI002B25B0CF|nr:ankyrin repeat domain-containing protein [Candidatus Trichorickettsia mobilis]WPY01909.1 Ankyrin repeat domain-containing protein [Candidatus Trichorickettsia mobilis]